MNQNIQNFIDKVSALDKDKYAHFIYKSHSYLEEIERDCHRVGIYNLDPKLKEMHNYLHFAPQWGVDSIYKRLIIDAQYLDELLMAHKQDWESPVPHVP